MESRANGRIVIGGSIVLPILCSTKDDVILNVSEGYVTKIEGSEEAVLFRDILKRAQEKEVYNIGEFGIGLNPLCKICGSMLEDEGVYGTIHFGIGDNHTMGGAVESSMHTDVVLKNPTVFIDGKIIIKSGEHLL